jgi:hypothetical protein
MVLLLHTALPIGEALGVGCRRVLRSWQVMGSSRKSQNLDFSGVEQGQQPAGRVGGNDFDLEQVAAEDRIRVGGLIDGVPP